MAFSFSDKVYLEDRCYYFSMAHSPWFTLETSNQGTLLVGGDIYRNSGIDQVQMPTLQHRAWIGYPQRDTICELIDDPKVEETRFRS